MAERETLQTKVVTLVYPKVTKPDTYGPKADGRFKTQFQFRTKDGEYDEAGTKEFQAWCKAQAKLLGPKTAKPKMPWNKDEDTGEVTFRCGSKYRPIVVDSKNTKVADDLPIGGGSRGRLGVAPNFYDGRLSLYFNELQLTKFVEYVRKERQSTFEAYEDDEDAFVAETTEETETGDTDGTEEDL